MVGEVPPVLRDHAVVPEQMKPQTNIIVFLRDDAPLG